MKEIKKRQKKEIAAEKRMQAMQAKESAQKLANAKKRGGDDEKLKQPRKRPCLRLSTSRAVI
jgi:hypothetical protein